MVHSLNHIALPRRQGGPDMPRLAAMVLQADWQALLGDMSLSGAQWQALDAMVRLRRLTAGDPVFQRGQAAGGLVAVCQGTVGLGQVRPDLEFQLERSVSGPQWLDLHSAWLGQPHAQEARAQSAAVVLDWPLAPARSWLLQQPAVLERLLMALARQVRELTGVTHDLMHKDAERRLAAWLLQRADGASQLRLGERKRDIAAQLGITPETLSRMMRQLKLKGLVTVQGYRVDVLDRPGLERLARD
mgnify:CR=1 FL=1|jgi:CRP-like cAMP-binding protein